MDQNPRTQDETTVNHRAPFVNSLAFFSRHPQLTSLGGHKVELTGGTELAAVGRRVGAVQDSRLIRFTVELFHRGRYPFRAA